MTGRAEWMAEKMTPDEEADQIIADAAAGCGYCARLIARAHNTAENKRTAVQRAVVAKTERDAP